MIKGVIYLLTIIMGTWVIGERLMAEEKSPKFNEVQIILYQRGKQEFLDKKSPYFQEALDECEKLFLTADNTYLLILHDELISQVKNKMAIEVIYPIVHKAVHAFRSTSVYYTRLLIPLQGRFSNGTVFFAGIHEYELKRDKPDLIPEQNYSYVDQYRVINFILNTKGLSKLKEILQKMSIAIN